MILPEVYSIFSGKRNDSSIPKKSNFSLSSAINPPLIMISLMNNLPSSIHMVGDHAFDGCRNIKELNLTDRITVIGEYAFQGMQLLTAVTVYNSTNSIGGIVLEKYLKPSIVVNELVSREREIIDEIKRLRPLEFNNLSELDLLGKCQHFSLPTRLLDFSRSPYVALFFAVTYFQKCPFNLREIDKCPNFLDRDYKVYCVAAKLKKSIYTSKIASVATKFNNGEDNFVEDFLFGENFSKENFVRAVEDIICEAHFFYPKFYTQREQNQQSIFLILSNYIQNHLQGNNYKQTLDKQDQLLNTCALRPPPRRNGL